MGPPRTAVEIDPCRRLAAAAMLLLASGAADAHSFGKLYNLPVPFWLYAYGATASLLLSFLIVGLFVTSKHASGAEPARDVSQASWLRALRWLRLMPALRALSLGALLLCLATAFFGHRNPYTNFSMTWFWVIFLLGFLYLAALLGDAIGRLNPWRVLADGLTRLQPRYGLGRFAYPARLAYWPALALYMLLIWLELFWHIRPFRLGLLLGGYTLLNLAGVWCVGTVAWFRHCEIFSVMFRLVGLMSPFDYSPGRLRLRVPFTGLLEQHAGHTSLLLFVLFMLSSTAFDGLTATMPWMKLFWHDRLGLIAPFIGGEKPILQYPLMRPWYELWEAFCLLLSPFLYWAVYLLFLALAKAITRSPVSLHTLSLRFAFTLLPIALVYNMTHYYTLLFTQGVKIVSLLSDPFGYGWDLLGTAGLWSAPLLPSMPTVWHSQVGLILFGHIVSVWLAHQEALRTFATRRQAVLSQMPMLVLMVLFTTVGLWILSQPLQMGR